MPNAIRLLQLILPWFSIVFYPKKSFKRFLPVSIVASMLVIGMCILAVPYKWWEVKGGFKSKVYNDLSFLAGPFFVGTLWIFYFTYGNFKRYFLTNLVFDGLFSFPLAYLYQKAKLFKLVNFKPVYIFLSFMSYSIFIYGFERLLKKER